MLHACNHPPNNGDVAIQLPRAVADHDIKLRARAAVSGHIASHADHAIAVRQPGLSTVHRGGKAIDKTDAGGEPIPVRQPREGHAAIKFAGKLGRDRRRRRPKRALARGVFPVGIAPLSHEIVLHAIDRQAIEKALAHKCFDVFNCSGREAWRQRDHDRAPI